MLIFKKEKSKSYTSVESGIYIEDAQYYSFCDDDQNMGHFYCTQIQAAGSYKDSRMLILLTKSTFRNRHYELKNLNNNASVGYITISNFVAGKSLKTTVDIIHKDLYNWQVLDPTLGFSLFTSKTRGKFSARLFNAKEEAIYIWDYENSEVYRYKLEQLPITGEVQMSNPGNNFLLFVGLFLMEMELQLKAVD